MTETPRRRPTSAHTLVIAHALIVAATAGAFLGLETSGSDDVPDANIGAGLVLMLLVLLGLPWSIPAIRSDTAWELRFGLVVAAAVLNVLLHACVRRLRRR